jgi:plastocyanin
MRTASRLTAHHRSAAAVVAALAMSACGGGSGSSTPATPADVAVLAVDTRYDQTEYTTTAGDVTFSLVGRGTLIHDLLIDDATGAKVQATGSDKTFKLQVGNGDTKQGTVTLAAGTYTMYCDLPGHRSQGMEAKLTVT